MSVNDLAQAIWALLNDIAIQPVVGFFLRLDQGDRPVLFALLAVAGTLGYASGRRRTVHTGRGGSLSGWRLPTFQNRGEASVARVLRSNFGPPDYHLMNHVTLPMEGGTTQVDHVLVSRFGVFVIETKDYSGWIFADATDATWTQVLFRQRFTFQNPIFQNYRHVRAVRALLDFLPAEAVNSVVVFSGNAEFKTERPAGVITIGELADYVRQHPEPVMTRNRQQFCVGRLETARLAVSRETDVEHVERLARRHGVGKAL